MEFKKMSIELQIKQAAERAVLAFIGSSDWLMPDYANRIKVPAELISSAWAMVDVDVIKKRIAARIEAELADRVMNHLAAEMATDIKQILSVQERREALRSVARAHIDQILRAGITQC